MPIRILTQEDLMRSGCLDYSEALEVVEDAFVKYAKGDVIFPDKVSVVFNKESQNRINCLPAGIISENVYGMKWVYVYPENPKKFHKPNLSAVYLLSELTTGFPIAFMEGSMCSSMRTACVGALAAKYLAKKNSQKIGFIGAGEQAKAHFLALKQVLPKLKVCNVSSRTTESAELFIKQMKQYHNDVSFVNCKNDYESSVKDADIIVTAISGQEQILKADWVKKGCFYCHVAGLEDEFSVAQKADKIVCDKWDAVKHRTQTISQMYQKGILKDTDIYADLHELVLGEKNGRESEDEFIYFNSVGLSFVDVALANWMFKKAVRKELGTIIEMR